MNPPRCSPYLLLGICLVISSCRAPSIERSPENQWERGKLRAYAFGPNIADYSIEEMQEVGINLVGAGAGYNLEHIPDPKQTHGDDELRERIRRYHQSGIRVVGGTSLARVHWEELLQQHPEAKDHVVLAPDGTPELFKSRPHQYIANLLDPYWIDLHSQGIEYVIDTGTDAIHLDNPFVVFSYDRRTQEMWEEYVSSAFGRPGKVDGVTEVREMTRAAIDDELLEDFPLQFPAAETSADPVLQANLQVFRLSNFVRFLKALRANADRAGGIKFDFNGHLDTRSFYYWTEAREHYDFICLEISTGGTWWFPPQGQGILGYKVAYACSNNKPTWVKMKLLKKFDEPIWFDAAQRYYSWDWLLPAPDRHELLMAEAAAMGGMVVPTTPVYGYTQTLNKRYEHYPETVKKYYSFQRDMEYFNTGTTSPARVALLVSHRSYIYGRQQYKQSMCGIGDFLLKNHIPFDVKVVENEDTFFLDGYTTLIANHLSVVSERSIRAIQDRVEKGATLLVLGDIGTRSVRNFLPNRSPPFERSHGTTASGEGKIVWFPFTGTELYQPFNHPHTHECAEELANVLEPEREFFRVSSQTKGENLIVLVPREKEQAFIVHCLNYNFSLLLEGTEEEKIARERVIPQEDVQIHIPKGMVTDLEKVTMFTPGGGKRELTLESTGQHYVFSLPQLDVYAMIVCRKE